MDTKRLSLMTFPLGIDLWKKTMTVQETLQLAQGFGIGSVDVMNVSKKQIPLYQDAVRESGVKIYVYIEVISFLKAGSHRIKQTQRAIDIAKQLGATYLMIVPYSGFDVYRARKMGKEKVFEKMIAGFRDAVSMGQRAGIRICVETTPHDGSCFSGTEDCLRILRSVEGLDFVFDTANMLPHGDDPLVAYEKLKDRIAYVHLKDVRITHDSWVPSFAEHTPDNGLMECVLWGEGIIPVKQIYETMLVNGYTGRFAIEYKHPDGDACGIQQHKLQLQKFIRYLSSD